LGHGLVLKTLDLKRGALKTVTVEEGLFGTRPSVIANEPFELCNVGGGQVLGRCQGTA
jgi:hypothetical protein